MKEYRIAIQRDEGDTDQELRLALKDNREVRLSSLSRTFGAGYPEGGALMVYAQIHIPPEHLGLLHHALGEILKEVERSTSRSQS